MNHAVLMTKNMMRKSIPLIAMPLFSACAQLAPKPEQLQRADFGPKPLQGSVLPLVKAYMSQRLFDPSSAVYQCGEPLKAWVNWYGSLYFGYVIRCSINAKNRFGGYAGAQQNVFMISDGRVALNGDDFAHIGYVP